MQCVDLGGRRIIKKMSAGGGSGRGRAGEGRGRRAGARGGEGTYDMALTFNS